MDTFIFQNSKNSEIEEHSQTILNHNLNLDDESFLTQYDIKDIINRINGLKPKEKLHILKILNSYNINFSKNTNGYFFNLSNIDDNILEKICNCLVLIEKNRDILKSLNEKREKNINHYKLLIEERLKSTIQNKNSIYIKSLLINDDFESLHYTIRKRQCKFKKINFYSLYKNDDPDEIIKLYNKSLYNFEKESVYGRIFSKIKNKNRKKHDKTNDKDSLIDIPINADEEFDNFDFDENDDNYDFEDVDVDEDPDIDKSKKDDDDVDIDSENDPEVQTMIGNGEPEEEHDKDSFDEIELKIQNEKILEKKLLFYKSLLYKKGFHFDENERCILQQEKYIE